jgi:acyl carrier protein
VENSKKLAALTDNLPLLQSGLDSLCLAVIVARLEDELGTDPFNTTQDLAFPVTIGEFIELYENAVV